jgi:hypothetical protein
LLVDFDEHGGDEALQGRFVWENSGHGCRKAGARRFRFACSGIGARPARGISGAGSRRIGGYKAGADGRHLARGGSISAAPAAWDE